MTIYQEITKDHESHRGLLDKLTNTSGATPERRALWQEFYRDVKAHAAAEEETFYSKLSIGVEH